MAKLPTNAPDPEPGDFDAELAALDPTEVPVSEGNPDARLSIQVTVAGDDATRLKRIARARGERPGEVVAELLRAADSRVA
jgi:hypothetical protein